MAGVVHGPDGRPLAGVDDRSTGRATTPRSQDGRLNPPSRPESRRPVRDRPATVAIPSGPGDSRVSVSPSTTPGSPSARPTTWPHRPTSPSPPGDGSRGREVGEKPAYRADGGRPGSTARIRARPLRHRRPTSQAGSSSIGSPGPADHLSPRRDQDGGLDALHTVMPGHEARPDRADRDRRHGPAGRRPARHPRGAQAEPLRPRQRCPEAGDGGAADAGRLPRLRQRASAAAWWDAFPGRPRAALLSRTATAVRRRPPPRRDLPDEDVPAGRYVLKLPFGGYRGDSEARLAFARVEVVVPEVPGGRSDVPLDLGAVPL